MKLKASLMSALSLLVACGGGGDGPPVGRSPGEPVGLPLIERPVQAGYSCQLTQPLTSLGIPSWALPALVPGKPPLLVWHTGCRGSCDDVTDLALAPLEDRVLGEPRPLFAGTDGRSGIPSLAVNGKRITAVWKISDDDFEEDARLMLAQLNQAGDVLTPPHALPLTGLPGSFAIAASASAVSRGRHGRAAGADLLRGPLRARLGRHGRRRGPGLVARLSNWHLLGLRRRPSRVHRARRRVARAEERGRHRGMA